MSLHFPRTKPKSLLLFSLWLFRSQGLKPGVRTSSPFEEMDLLTRLAIFCFAFHQLRSTAEPKDAIYHQRQAILRNAQSPFNTVNRLAQLGWKWRKTCGGGRSQHALRRQLPFLIAGLMYIVGFFAAGLFSTSIATIGDEVLLVSSNCGWVNTTSQWDSTSDWTWIATLTEDMTADQEQSSSYVRECYGPENGTSHSSCNIYSAQSINSTPAEGAPTVACPFPGKTVCSKPSEIIRVESDLVDSNRHLGINAPRADSVQYRRITTCAKIEDSPSSGLASQPYTKSDNESEGPSFTDFYYTIPTGSSHTDNITWSSQTEFDNTITVPQQPYHLK